jgi:hypothetical protein
MPIPGNHEAASIDREVRLAVVDTIRSRNGDPPKSVLGFLIAQLPDSRVPNAYDDGVTPEEIAGRLEKDTEEVNATVAMLQEEELCGVVAMDGLTKVFAFAPFTVKNGTPPEEVRAWAES